MASTERQAELDRRLERFERRAQADVEFQNRNRPQRSATEVVDAAAEVIQRQQAQEDAKLQNSSFRMAAQEQAQRERVRELGWLLEDLEEVKKRLAGEGNA